MRYRTRLILAFLALVVVTASLLFFGSLRISQREVTDQIRSTVLSVAASAAGLVDAELHESIRTADDLDSPAYTTIERELRRVRDANRRDDIYIPFIYTMRKVSSDPDVWQYVVDAEEPGDDKSEIGEVITWEEQHTEGDEPLVLGGAYADQKFIHDDYGYWLTAYAPVRDATGQPVAMVGADIRATHVIAARQALLRSGIVALSIALAAGTVLSLLLARWAARPLATIARAVGKIGDGRLETRVKLPRADKFGEFGELANSVNEMANSLQERDALKGALSRIVSHGVAERLVSENRLPKMDGEYRVVTVLVSDIDNLSRLASSMEPGHLLGLLNEYFEAMVEIVFHHGGTIDRLLGNRLIAVFGAPLEDPNKERNAVQAAVAMSEETDRLNERWDLPSDSQFQFGVGVHTGEAIIGNVGANQIIEFTVVGESVDIATMIEGLAPAHRARGLVSDTTVEAVRNEFPFQEVGDIQPQQLGSLLRLYTLAELR